MADRQQIRTSVGDLYGLRNQATHGGQFKAKKGKSVDGIIDTTSEIYMKLATWLLTTGVVPDWPTIELEPSSRDNDESFD